MNTYGNYVRVEPDTPEGIERAEEQMRQQALDFLQEMGQPVERMNDVEIIIKHRKDSFFPDGSATVGWKVAI